MLEMLKYGFQFSDLEESKQGQIHQLGELWTVPQWQKDWQRKRPEGHKETASSLALEWKEKFVEG